MFDTLFGKITDNDNDRNRECSLDESEVHDLLSNERRREVIEILSSSDRMTVGRLADKISNRQNCGRQTVYIALYQNHLEILANHHVVEYNQDRGIVRKGKNLGPLEAIMQTVQDRLK